MSGSGEWHADERLLAGYVAGTLALPAAMSLEQHVMRCPRCRDAVAGQVDPRPLELVWQGIEARVDGSFRLHWRRFWFRLRTRGLLRPPAIRPGGMAIGGMAMLSVGYLAAGLLALGGPVRGPVPDDLANRRAAALAQQADRGRHPGQLAPVRGWSFPVHFLIRPGRPV